MLGFGVMCGFRVGSGSRCSFCSLDSKTRQKRFRVYMSPLGVTGISDYHLRVYYSEVWLKERKPANFFSILIPYDPLREALAVRNNR